MIAQYFLAPVITALVILSVQFFVQPILETKKVANVELWKDKKNTFLEAVNLVDEKYQTLQFDQSNKNDIATKFTNIAEVNRIYVKLLILSKDQTIPEKFWHFFDDTVKGFSPAERGEFILLLQKELGQKNKTPPEKIPVFKSIKN
jgi:hypothetical protein